MFESKNFWGNDMSRIFKENYGKLIRFLEIRMEFFIFIYISFIYKV